MLTDLKPCPFCGGQLGLKAKGHSDDCYIMGIRRGYELSAGEWNEAWNRRAIEAEVLQSQPLTCSGCGSTMTDADLAIARKERGIIACCPDRRMEATPQPPAPCPKCDSGVLCADCNDTGWLENREDGRYPCTCMTEAEPYQILQTKVADLEVDNMAAWATADRHMTERSEARERIAEQAALIEKCEKGLAAVEWLISDSQGVIGLHLNGDSAPWASLRTGGHFETWLIEFDEALAAISAQKGGAA